MSKSTFSDLLQHMWILAYGSVFRPQSPEFRVPWVKDPIHDLLWYGPLKGTLTSDSQLRAILLQVSDLSILSPGRCCHGPRHLS